LTLTAGDQPDRLQLELARELPSLLGHVSPPARNLRAYLGVHQAGAILEEECGSPLFLWRFPVPLYLPMLFFRIQYEHEV
ncbi:hypothetical protein, partial [Longimicrobium sp.]|uniref:hypothetical protein n=1 Tax=Longimicrobium sp. TaxID=2029185 RepID=UPI003B3B1617